MALAACLDLSSSAAALPDCSAARPNFPAALAPPTVAPPRDGIYNLIMITLFRIAFARALGQQSTAPWFPAASSYDGLVDMARGCAALALNIDCDGDYAHCARGDSDTRICLEHAADCRALIDAFHASSQSAPTNYDEA